MILDNHQADNVSRRILAACLFLYSDFLSKVQHKELQMFSGKSDSKFPRTLLGPTFMYMLQLLNMDNQLV